ncbi:MAG: hypothetical protein JNK72_21805 [Myxococcales bacterium]|nr:hypothetical protein [Myxococcales bacterium]
MGLRWALWGVVVFSALVTEPMAQVPETPRVSEGPDPRLATWREMLSGRYREVSGDENRAARDVAIRRSVEALFPLWRGIATSRIADGNPVFPTVQIAFHGGDVEIETPPVRALSPENGDERRVVGFDHESNHVTHRITPTSLTQTTWTSAGSRTTRFDLSADGRRLSLAIEIRSPRLPVPVRYAMHYHRVE